MKADFVLPIVAFILLWETVSTSGVVNASLFPPPSAVFSSFLEVYGSGELGLHCLASLKRVSVGLTLGGVTGVVFGLATGRSGFCDCLFSPIIQVFRSVPPVAVIPLIIVWFGIGETAKVMSIGFAVFFPVWLNTHIGSAQIPPHYLQAAKLLTKSKSKRWLGVVLPACLPFIVAGVRNGIALSYIMVYVSELAGASSGIGYLISVSYLAYRIDKMMCGIILLGVCGALTDRVFSKASRRFFPWIEKT